MKGDECPVAIPRWELRAGIKQQSIRRPVRGEKRGGRSFRGAVTNGFASVTAILRRENQLLLIAIEVAARPAEIGVVLDREELFSREVLPLVGGVELGRILRQLIPSVLRRPELALTVDGDADGVPDASCITTRRREGPTGLVRIVLPDAAARPELRARIVTRRVRHAIRQLARVRGRAEVD